MQINIVLGLSLLSALGAAENTVERDDIPRACLTTCQSIIDLSARCDRTTDDDAYRRCVCLEPDAQLQLNQCAVCVQQNGMRDPDDNDVADLMDDCGWDFNQASASLTAVTSTTAASPTTVVSTSTGPSTTAIITQTPSSTAPTTTTGTTTSTTSSGSNAAQTSAEVAPDNAGPAVTAGPAGLLIAAGAAMLLF